MSVVRTAEFNGTKLLDGSAVTLDFQVTVASAIPGADAPSRLARNQILSQAAVSVLAQANQQPQLALKLLG